VYSREQDGEEIFFGTTGYTMDSVFVLYDRQTESVWYPLKRGQMNAVSGPRKGDAIPILEKPKVVALGEWFESHPDSMVLVPAPRARTIGAAGGVNIRPRPVQAATVTPPDQLGPTGE